MIHACLQHIASQLNQFLKNNFDLTEDIVIVSNLVESDGSVVSQTNNKVVVFLSNMEKDTMPQHQGQPSRGKDGRLAVSSAPVYLNLYVVIAANFGAANYGEALKFISNAVAFFQRQPMFDQQNSPDMDDKIHKMILDIENVARHDLSSMWGMFGAKYLPSMVYRVRMVSLGGGAVQSQVGSMQQGQVQLEKG
ncbi:MAG: hypothetical protein ACI8WB_001350 [Phenylobacterium sp.]|jgi:hypothetical protein